jgi:hypothetical protein
MANRDNQLFYDQMSAEDLNIYVTKIGLTPAVDIDLIISKLGFFPTSVLEVGAGAGRVVDALLAKLDACTIYALERSPNFIKHLQGKFTTNSRVRIIEGDVSSLPLPIVDLTLWMWSGITDFGPEEQPRILSRLAACTRSTVVLETPAEGEITVAQKVDGQWHSFTSPTGVEYRGYVPTVNEIMGYARMAQMHWREPVEYYSSIHRRRILYFLDS